MNKKIEAAMRRINGLYKSVLIDGTASDGDAERLARNLQFLLEKAVEEAEAEKQK